MATWRPSPSTACLEQVSIVEADEWRPTQALYLASAALAVLIPAVSIEATSLSVALPIMSSSLSGTALQAFQCGTSYLLASTVVLPSFANLSDIFAERCSISFISGSLVAGLANNFQVLFSGRTLMGIGEGGIIVVSEMVMVDLVPLAHRGTYIGLFSLIWAGGTMAGPLIGAGFAQDITWRWIFLINLPISGLAILMILFFFNQKKLTGDLSSKVLLFDWTGALFFTASATSFLYGITIGGVLYNWSSYHVVLPLVFSLVGVVIFTLWERFLTPRTLFQKDIFVSWSSIAVYIGVKLHGAVTWALAYYGVLFYQGAKLYSPITSALAFLPETVTAAPTAGIPGLVASKTQRYRWALWTGWVLATLGTDVLYYMNSSTSVMAWIFLNTQWGSASACCSPVRCLRVKLLPVYTGAAAGFFAFLRTFGQSVGVAGAGVIFQNSFRGKLAVIPELASLADEYLHDATVVVAIIQAMPAGDTRDTLGEAYADALKNVWLSLTGFAAAGLVLSLTVKGFTINQEHVTKQRLINGRKYRKSGMKMAEEGPGSP
ncbi:major facilitator superfamily domain-containing protein [Xylariales sp. PMI_506]|nr:major facilitator superfamily domain-containing protein [Xylariales sp. PMI_506]